MSIVTFKLDEDRLAAAAARDLVPAIEARVGALLKAAVAEFLAALEGLTITVTRKGKEKI
jgi:hypothetical protein